MSVRHSPLEAGERRSRQLRQRVADELATARLSAGLSVRQVATTLGVPRARVARAERGEPEALTIDLVARLAAVLGMSEAVNLYPDGTPVRDRAHLALLHRFRARLPASVPIRFEVPVPIAGDRRSADAVITAQGRDILVEAETHLYDVQAQERRAGAKARDLGCSPVILLIADTAHNRRVIRETPSLRAAFPIGTRAALRALAAGRVPAADALVVL